MTYLKNYYFICIIFISSFAHADIISYDGCKTKLVQILTPEWPRSNYQGYSIINFKINKDGSISNSKVDESMCAMSRDENGSIIFKSCPYFKGVSIAASKYLKYKPPLNESNVACTIPNHRYKYNFSLYNIKIIDNNFILRDEYQVND